MKNFLAALFRLASTSLLGLSMAMAGASVAPAQENTVENWSWKPDFFQTFGRWESVCDMREHEGETLRRCYVSLVDVYSPRPQFGAAFMFLTPAGGDALRYEFRFERGTRFADAGFAFDVMDGEDWVYDLARCPDLKCILEGEEASALAKTMSGKGSLKYSFIDRYKRQIDLDWPADGFAEALDIMMANAAERGLR